MMKGLNEDPRLNSLNGVDDKFFGIIRTALKYKPEYIHFDWIESYYFRRYPFLTYLSVPVFLFQIWICKYLLRIKIAWTLHNLTPHDKRQLKVKKFVQRKFAKTVEFIRVLSPGSSDDAATILKVNKNKIRFVATGSFTDFYPNNSNRELSIEKLALPKSKRVILFLGSIKSYKGVLDLITVIKEINLDNGLLLIAGKSYDPAYLSQVKKNLTENIILHEKFVGIEELQYYFNVADLVVYPFTEVENSGSVIMAAGFKKAVVAPDSNVLKFRLQNQKELLYQPGGLKSTLLKALTMKQDELDHFGQLNYEYLKSYNWNDFGKLFK